MVSRNAAHVRFIPLPSDGALPRDFSPEEILILDQVNRKVAAAESLKSIVDFLFDSTHDIFPCDRIGLAFLEDDGRRVASHYARALYEPLLLDSGYAEDLQGSSLREVIAAGEPRIIDDLEAYLREHPHSPSTKLLLKEGVRSSMTCPLIVEGRNVGLLFRSSRHAGAYDEHQAWLHLAVAERLGQAVEKALRIEQLSEANRSYMEMLGFVSHELKSPLSSIIMDGKLLTDAYLGQLEPRQREKVQRMVGKAEYLVGLIREYLDLARLEGGELTLRRRPEVDVAAAVIDAAIDIASPQIEERGVKLSVEMAQRPLPAECDPELLKIALVNLIGNAVKYGNEKGRVKVSAKMEGGGLCVSVWNEGPGFSDADRALLFRKFSRLPSPELINRKGSGLGLYTTWRIVNLHGGRIWAASEQGKWAEFTFTIPLAEAPKPSA